jgi:hypothetical protein
MERERERERERDGKLFERVLREAYLDEDDETDIFGTILSVERAIDHRLSGTKHPLSDYEEDELNDILQDELYKAAKKARLSYGIYDFNPKGFDDDDFVAKIGLRAEDRKLGESKAAFKMRARRLVNEAFKLNLPASKFRWIYGYGDDRDPDRRWNSFIDTDPWTGKLR